MKSIRNAFGITLAVSVLALAPGAATAQSAQQACAPDIQKYCAGVPQGEGKIAECLRSHKQELSPACQSGMAKTATLMKEVVAA